MKIKKTIYITLFTILGILLSILAHAIIEVFYIKLLLIDFEKYSLGFSWNALFTLHAIYIVVFFILGVWFGLSQGKYWWRKIYEEGGVQRIRSLMRFLFTK